MRYAAPEKLPFWWCPKQWNTEEIVDYLRRLVTSQIARVGLHHWLLVRIWFNPLLMKLKGHYTGRAKKSALWRNIIIKNIVHKICLKIHFIRLFLFVLHQMQFIPSNLNTRFLRYGQFTDMRVNCSVATFQHLNAVCKPSWMVTFDGGSKLGNWLSVKPCCSYLYFSYILDLLFGFS